MNIKEHKMKDLNNKLTLFKHNHYVTVGSYKKVVEGESTFVSFGRRRHSDLFCSFSYYRPLRLHLTPL